jgi:transposase
LKDAYSDAGRPSIDPELLLRLLLVGYLYGVTSERKLVEELRMHLAWRWFTGLGLDQEIPNHSTFSKNRHGRFQESNLFQKLFEEIVTRCVEAGLVKGEHISVDGSFIQANADHHRRVLREQLILAGNIEDQASRSGEAGRCDSTHWIVISKRVNPDSVNPRKQFILLLSENLRMSVFLELEHLLDPNGPSLLGRDFGKWLKDMVGTSGLEPQTSIVSR